MNIEEELFLGNEPLPESETSITLDIFSSQTTMRGEPKGLVEKRVLEGKITVNPERCLIYLIPQFDHDSSLAPARTRWDFYLIVIPFTLHKAPGNKYYQEVTFLVSLTSSEATAFDLFPKEVLHPIESTKAYTVSAAMRIVDVEMGMEQMTRQIRFGTLRPTIHAFGEGDSTFYWTYTGADEPKQVAPGTKHALVVLQVPRGTASVSGELGYEVTVMKTLLGIWRDESAETESLSMAWNLQEALPFWNAPVPKTASPTGVKAVPAFDVCVFCALAEETRAFIKIVAERCGVQFQKGFSKRGGYEYCYTTIRNNKGEPLTIHLSWLPEVGPLQAGLHIYPVLDEFRPRFAAMTGFCAGDKRAVELGDVVVAERTFIYDSGKFTRTANGQHVQRYDVHTSEVSPRVGSFIQMFDGWEPFVKDLHRPSTLQQAPVEQLPRCHIATLASGSAVRGDDPFDEIQVPERKTIALDMEGAALYRTVGKFPGMHALLVKGIADYADGSKGDSYHDYASQVSAAYMLSFIQEYVTLELMPRSAGL